MQQLMGIVHCCITSHVKRGMAILPGCRRPGDLQLNDCTNFGCMLLHELLAGKQGEGKADLAHGGGGSHTD